MLGISAHTISKSHGVPGSILTETSMPTTSHRFGVRSNRFTAMTRFPPRSAITRTQPRLRFPRRSLLSIGSVAPTTSPILRTAVTVQVVRSQPVRSRLHPLPQRVGPGFQRVDDPADLILCP